MQSPCYWFNRLAVPPKLLLNILLRVLAPRPVSNALAPRPRFNLEVPGVLANSVAWSSTLNRLTVLGLRDSPKSLLNTFDVAGLPASSVLCGPPRRARRLRSAAASSDGSISSVGGTLGDPNMKLMVIPLN